MKTPQLCALSFWAIGSLFAGCGAPPSTATAPPAAGDLPVTALEPVRIADSTSAVEQFPAAADHANAELSYALIPAPNGTFGYEITSAGKLLIRQTNLPGLPGIEGCRTKADAQALAAFVMEKIKKGEMPPTISTEELKGLGLLP